MSVRAAITRVARAEDPAIRRLRFWLVTPFAGDGVLLVAGVIALVLGNPLGWYLVWFAVARAVIGVVALAWIAPRMIRRTWTGLRE